MKVWEKGADFLEELLADKDVRAALSEAEIREKFDLGYHTKHVDTIFRRVFGRTARRNLRLLRASLSPVKSFGRVNHDRDR